MRKQILFILSTLALLMHPLSLSAQNSTAGDQDVTPDFDGDGQVGFPDFLMFTGRFGARQGDGRYDARYDLDSDGEIGFSDFLIFVNSFNKEVSPQVSIPDENLRAVIESHLNKASGAPITQGEMAALTRLDASNANISDLTGLEFATRLTNLDLGVEVVGYRRDNSNEISNLSPLSGLTSLEVLNLGSNDISDVSPLSDLTNLTTLFLDNNWLSDVSPLSGLTNLTTLSLNNNNISNVSPLSGLTNLTTLSLDNNNIYDVSPLSGLTNLTTLSLDNNNISDLVPLIANTGLGSEDEVNVGNNPLSAASINTHIPALQSRGVTIFFGGTPVSIPDANLRAVLEGSLRKANGETITRDDVASLTRLDAPNANIRDLTGLEFATNLDWLDLGVENVDEQVNSNEISNLSPLSGLTNLEVLILSSNSISDVSPLSGLISLEFLVLFSNNISDVSPLSGLSLRSLSLSSNSISDVSALSDLISLETLVLSSNSISDVSPLSGLTNLRFLSLPSNSISDVSPLSGLTNLTFLSLFSNSISDLSPLVANTGLGLSAFGSSDVVDIRDNPLSDTSLNTHIPALQSRGVDVRFGALKPAVEKK